MKKTQDYLEVFSRFKQQETAQAVERILVGQSDLSSFERAQLGTSILSPSLVCVESVDGCGG